jgi:hypothetical protein
VWALLASAAAQADTDSAAAWFKPQPPGCDLSLPSTLEQAYWKPKGAQPKSFYETCLAERKVDFDKFRGRNLYIFGNSVYRHYSFAVPMLFDSVYNSSSILPRAHEKNACQGDLDDTSCDHFTMNRDTMVRFMWKNFIGYEQPLHDDSGRDICGSQPEQECVPKLFKQARAADILLVGAIPVDTLCYRNRSYSSLDSSTLKMCQDSLSCGLDAEYVAKILRNILKHFPGVVMWGSYHWVKNEEKHMQCFRTIQEIIATAVRMVNSPRVKNVYLVTLQREFRDLYVDGHHHPGRLSELVLRLLYLQLADHATASTSTSTSTTPTAASNDVDTANKL